MVGSNNADRLVKYLISVDPAITFLSSISDEDPLGGKHSLIARAISLPGINDTPYINYQEDLVGNLKKFDPYVTQLSSWVDTNNLNLNIGAMSLDSENNGYIAGNLINGASIREVFIKTGEPGFINATQNISHSAQKEIAQIQQWIKSLEFNIQNQLTARVEVGQISPTNKIKCNEKESKLLECETKSF
jgi:hypothetical protein